jgi:hypothetical protein
MKRSSKRDGLRGWVHYLGIRWADGWNKVPHERQKRFSIWIRRRS